MRLSKGSYEALKRLLKAMLGPLEPRALRVPIIGLKGGGGSAPPHTPASAPLAPMPGPWALVTQKEGQEDQGTLKQLGGLSRALFPLPGPYRLPSGSSLGFLELPQVIYF